MPNSLQQSSVLKNATEDILHPRNSVSSGGKLADGGVYWVCEVGVADNTKHALFEYIAFASQQEEAAGLSEPVRDEEVDETEEKTIGRPIVFEPLGSIHAAVKE